MIKGIFMVSGYLPLIILYGVGNFDNGKDNKKLLGYTLLNALWLIMFCCSFLSASTIELISSIILLASYPIILTVCGIYNRKHNKTFYALNQLLEETLKLNDCDCFQLRVDSCPLKWSANFSLKGQIVSTWGFEGHRVSYYNY